MHKSADKWEKLPNGWTQESVKKFWGSLTGENKHKVTKCMKQMEGKVDNTGAFCASLADKVDPGWRSRRADLDDEFGGKAGGLADRDMKTAGTRELINAWGPVLKQASDKNLGDLINQAEMLIFQDALKRIKSMAPVKATLHPATNGMSLKGKDQKGRSLELSFYMVLEGNLEVKMTWVGRGPHGNISGEKVYRTYLFNAGAIVEAFRREFESA
jgi:hypothetical protein